MRIIKIGSSSNCDIVLHSTYVSALHAEITLLDSGEIFIEDKRSTNGTFVGNKRIQPGAETRVRRGDYVRFADVELVWGQVPSVESNANYKRVINIGSNYRNDIVISGVGVSRFHATVKIDKKNNVYIIDNHSVNGVIVNGSKIQVGRPVKLSRNDSVVCGNEDITMQLRPNFKSVIPSWTGWVAGIAAIAVIAYFIIGPIITIDPYKKYKDGVVYVHAGYRMHVHLKEFPDFDPLVYPDLTEQPMVYSGTAFFVDRDGRLCTNSHVAKPWKYSANDKKTAKTLQDLFDLKRHAQLPVEVVRNESDLYKLSQTSWGNAIIEYAEKKNTDESSFIIELNLLLTQLRKSDIEVSGKHEFLGIGYSSEYYSNNQYDACHLLGGSNDENIDVAFIRLDSKKTPDKVKNVIDINNAVLERPKVNDSFHVMGYSGGHRRSMDEVSKSLELSYKQTICCKEPNRYDFFLEHGVDHGASGSPVLDKKGRLIGIVKASVFGSNDPVTHANHARFIKELYDKEVR